MMLRAAVIGALLLGPSIAAGERLVYGPGDAAPAYAFVGHTRDDGLILARQVLPAQDTPLITDTRAVAVAQSRIVYLNKGGVTLSPGGNDARINRSTVVTTQTAITGWSAGSTVWAETVACMRELFAPFDVTIVEADPGNVPHIEAVFGGTPTQVGLDPGVLGVSPFTLDCGIIENSVVFTFTNAIQLSAREACEVMAQEVAHSYGLDHELLASDPMTYLPYTGKRAFKDQAAQCGESAGAPRPCGVNGSVCRTTQNSVALLRERLGVGDAIQPTIPAMSPVDMAVVPPGFQVKVNGADNLGVQGAVLKVDGVQQEAQSGAGPFLFTTSTALAEGPHVIVVDITDGKNVTTETRNVTVKLGAPQPTDEEPGEGGDRFGEVAGGCAAGRGNVGLLFALGLLVGLAIRRRP